MLSLQERMNEIINRGRDRWLSRREEQLELNIQEADDAISKSTDDVIAAGGAPEDPKARREREERARKLVAGRKILDRGQQYPTDLKIGRGNAQTTFPTALSRDLQGQGFKMDTGGQFKVGRNFAGLNDPNLRFTSTGRNDRKVAGLDYDSGEVDSAMKQDLPNLLRGLGIQDVAPDRRDWAKIRPGQEIADFQREAPFLDHDNVSAFHNQAGGFRDGNTEVRESLTLAAIQQLTRGRKMDNRELADVVAEASERYGIQPDKLQSMVASTQAQMEALEGWMGNIRDFEGYNFSRVGGTDTDIPRENQSTLVDDFNKSIGDYLGSDGLQQIYGSDKKDIFNPTDIFLSKGDREENMRKQLKTVFESYGTQENKLPGLKAAMQLIRGFTRDRDLIPLSLKDTAGYDAKATEQNYGTLSPEGIESLLPAAVMKPIELKMGLNNQFAARGDGKGMDSNTLDIPVAMRYLAHYLDDEDATQDIFANFRIYENDRQGSGKKADPNYAYIDPQALMTKRDDPAGENVISDAPERLGSFPAGQIPNIMQQASGLGAEEAHNNLGITRGEDGRYEWGDFNMEEDPQYWGQILEELAGYDQDGFKFDLSSAQFGDNKFEAGGYEDFMRQVFELDAAAPGFRRRPPGGGRGPAWENNPDSPGNLERLQEIMPGEYGLDDVTNSKIKKKIRLMLQRIRFAHGMMQMHQRDPREMGAFLGNLVHDAGKMQRSADRPLFPYLKLGTDPKMNADQFQEGLSLNKFRYSFTLV